MKNMRFLVLILSAFCFAFCSIFLVCYYASGLRAQEEMIGLIQAIEENAEETPVCTSSENPEERTVLPQYEELYQQNTDLIGWVSIEGTSLNYPVMFTPRDGEYYLHRNFNKEYEYRGLPFLDKNCDIERPSTNLLIYGHNMKNNTMFSSLLKYKDKEYYEEHPVICFDTIYEKGEYEIFGVILSRVYKKSDRDFKFYQFIEGKTKEEFDEYISNIRELALFETEIKPEFGDRLLTLITCSYHTENGRLAVVARRIDRNLAKNGDN